MRDKFKPSVFGVGFVGVGSHIPVVNRRATRAYGVWQSMLGRCYNVKVQVKCPTYKDCTVCDAWHNFQNFAEWYELNHIEGYQIDKDIKIPGNRVYSPETCLFVSPHENSIKANNKKYSFVCPSGKLVEVDNLHEFCDKD